MIDTFLINLDNSRDRFARASGALDAAGLRFTRFPAIDGRGTPPRAADGFARLVSGAEAGCRASHDSVLRAFLDSTARLALVFEDDVSAIDGRTLGRLTKGLGETDGWGVAHLSQPVRGFRSPWSDADGMTLYRAHLFPMTTAGLLWSRDGAREFLAHAPPGWPMDHALRHWALRADKGVGLERALVETHPFASDMPDRDALIDARYERHRARLRRRQKARAAWNRLRWRFTAR